MLEVRRSNERGAVDHGWLKSFHTFSFADYFDPKHVEFGSLRVINEDRVEPGAGFGTHGHQNMEILSYVLEGELSHKDSIGNGSTIRPGDFQLMSAGQGIRHSEFNGSQTEGVHFLQIWIQPNVLGKTPSYQEKHFNTEEKRGKLRLIVSPDGADGSLLIYQDAKVYVGLFNGEEKASLPIDSDRKAYIHLARGSVSINGQQLQPGDGLQLSDIDLVTISNGVEAEVLVFDLN